MIKIRCLVTLWIDRLHIHKQLSQAHSTRGNVYSSWAALENSGLKYHTEKKNNKVTIRAGKQWGVKQAAVHSHFS